MRAWDVNRKEGDMNNLQYLYMVNDDFQQFVNSHLVIFERWYTDDLGETRIVDDIEAHNWLMAERYGSGSDYNDGNLPEPCLRLDFGGNEFNSVELGDGTGFVRVGAAYNAIDNLTKEIATARYGMDFIMTRFPLIKENTIITDEAKINLITKVLNLLVAEEPSINRRLNNWICGLTSMQEDEPDYNSENMEYIMNLVTKSFEKIFVPEYNYDFEELKNKLNILKGFFKNNPKFSDFVLPKISLIILQCVVKYWQVELNGSENVKDNEVILKVTDFFSQNNYNELLWISLAEKLKSIIEKKDQENNEQNNINIDILKNFNEISEQKILEKLDENINQLKFCLIFIDISTNEGRIMNYLPIIMHLLNIYFFHFLYFVNLNYHRTDPYQ